MTGILRVRFTTILLALLSVGLLVLGVINFQQRAKYQLGDDGVSWLDSDQGVKAWIVVQDGPAARAGIHEGDILSAVNGVPVKSAEDVYRVIFSNGVWSQLDYELNRQGGKFETSLVTEPQENSKSVHGYLELVGLLYLFIGAFILVRRWSAPRSLHFYTFCLASFVLYAFSYTGKLNGFDSTIYWLNVFAWLLQPALFLHFCLRFPQRPSAFNKHTAILSALYLPGALLLALHVGVITRVVILPVSLLQSRWLIDSFE